nr:hypothetical protein [Tanacetum cinerariifolium]
MPKTIHLDHHDTAHYILLYHRTRGFIGHESEVYKSLVSRLLHEGRVIESTFLDDQTNLRPIFVAIGFDCLLDVNEKICPTFVLYFYKSVRLIRKLNETIAIAFVINNFEMTITLEEVYRFKDKGKRPHLPTLTPPDTESSDSHSPTLHQGVENDPVDNYTLDPILYMNQLLPIEGGDSLEFKQCSSAYSIFSLRSSKGVLFNVSICVWSKN